MMGVMREALTLREPSPPYLFDKKKPMSGTKVHPELEKLKNAPWLKQRSSSHDAKAPFGSVDRFIMGDDATHENIAAIARDIKNAKHIFRVDYQLQQMTNNMHRYRIMQFVDAESVANN